MHVSSSSPIVDDKIVIDLVRKQVELLELDHKSWIIEGFPRTKLQALSLQKAGIIPDRFILLNVERDRSVAQLKKTLQPFESIYGKEEIERMTQNSMNEYDLHTRAVRSAFNHFIYDYNAVGRSQADVANDIARMLRIKFKSSGPTRPARVILLGPPGSGRATQAKAIGERFGLVYVCTRRLLKHEVARGTPAGKSIQRCINEGTTVPDQIVGPLVEQRLKQTDCRVSGWILDGFPQSEEQINFLKSIKIKPSLVCVFEQPEKTCIERLSHRRVDTETGDVVDISKVSPSPEQAERLVQMKEDTEDMVKKRYSFWNQAVPRIEDAFKKVLLTI